MLVYANRASRILDSLERGGVWEGCREQLNLIGDLAPTQSLILRGSAGPGQQRTLAATPERVE